MRRQFVSVSALTAIALLTGFLKLRLTAQIFGLGPELDGYFLALVLPTMISGVLSGVLQTALFPVRSRLVSEQGQEAVEGFERSVLILLFLAGTVLSVVTFFLQPIILNWNGEPSAPAVSAAAQFVFPFAAFLIPLNAVGDGLGYLLAARNRYPVAAAAPIANALLGWSLLKCWPDGGLMNLAAGTTLGLFLQVSLCATALSFTGFKFLKPLPAVEKLRNEWREMFRLSSWILPGVIFSNLMANVPVAMIATYGEGAVSAFGYAWRFHQFSMQLLVMAASPLLLSHFATLVVADKEAEIRGLLLKGMWLSILTGCLSVGVVALYAQPGLLLIFSGKFDDRAADQVSEHWLWLAFGLAPALLGNICAKVWQARGRAGLMSVLAGLGLLVFLVANHVLADTLDAHSIAAAIGISYLTVTVIGWYFAWNAVRRDLPT